MSKTHDIRSRSVLILTLLTVLPASAWPATDDTAENAAWAMFEDLRGHMIADGPLTGRFVQTYVPAGYTEGITQEGRVSMKLPECIRWIHDDSSTLVCRGEAHYWSKVEGDEKPYEIKPRESAILDLFLAPTQTLRERFVASGERRPDGSSTISLAAPEADGGATVRIDTSGTTIERLELTDGEGNRVSFQLTDYAPDPDSAWDDVDALRVTPVSYGAARGSGSASRTAVISRRGDVRILLTGSCGSAGEGRTAILQHRDRHATVRVTTETARFRDGRLETSHRDTHTLAGGEEVRLGCTRAGSAELRYDLVGSSDNSVAVERAKDLRSPSRDFIVLTESGACGRAGQGRFVTALNRHPERSILAFIESVRKLDGRLKNRSVKSYRLEPGGEKQLGCNLDGALVQEYAVLDAK